MDISADPVRFDYPLTKYGNYGLFIAAMEADGTCPTFRIITEEEEVTKSPTSSPVVAPASSLIPITSSPTRTISLLGEGKYQTLSPTTRGINPIFSKSGKGSKGMSLLLSDETLSRPSGKSSKAKGSKGVAGKASKTYANDEMNSLNALHRVEDVSSGLVIRALSSAAYYSLVSWAVYMWFVW